MRYNFDQRIDRSGTDCIKYSWVDKLQKPQGILPMWVADMDFLSPPCVREALQAMVEHGIFGYSDTGERYMQVLQDWFSRRFDWRPEPEWLVKVPGIVPALYMAVRAYTAPGEAVLIQQPVYYPFALAVQDNDRRLVSNELVYSDGAYHVDFEAFERQIVENNVRLFILCSPHNPVGRVWTRDELLRMGDICLRHHVVVIADEIHADFVFPGHTQHVFAALKPEFAQNTLLCTAPSKTFNLAGLQLANLFIPHAGLRTRFVRELALAGHSQPSLPGIVACEAAYRGGEEWLEQLKEYLAENVALVRRFLQDRLPEIRLVEPQGTYLLWLDMRALGLDVRGREELLEQKARLWLTDGTRFGSGGEGFVRMNIACPRAVVEEALQRLERAVHER